MDLGTLHRRLVKDAGTRRRVLVRRHGMPVERIKLQWGTNKVVGEEEDS